MRKIVLCLFYFLTFILLCSCESTTVSAPSLPEVGDIMAPVLVEEGAVVSPNRKRSPMYVFNSSEEGSIQYQGDCSSETRVAKKGSNFIQFSSLEEGEHDNCVIVVADAKNNQSRLHVRKFSIDTTAPVLVQIKKIDSTTDVTPSYLFNASEPGLLFVKGGCQTAQTRVVEGVNSITMKPLSYGKYDNCTLSVSDAAGNMSNSLVIPDFLILRVTSLNDTGLSTCANYAWGKENLHNNGIACGVSAFDNGLTSAVDIIPAGQDAELGRDANIRTNDNADGYKGFSFTKLKNDGSALLDQFRQYDINGAESASTQWSCVRDNVTGLVWEMKTASGSGLQDKHYTYTWYSSNPKNNGGDHGLADIGVALTSGFEFGSELAVEGSDNCWIAGECDTEKYLAAVNASQLCGSRQWRLPTAQELISIQSLHQRSRSIDSEFFPTIIQGRYWTATASAQNIEQAWYVDFSDATVDVDSKAIAYSIVLVHD